MAVSSQFRTYQTVRNYEDALARHSQKTRWIKVLQCPCVNPTTGQFDIDCSICDGRGRIFKSPDEMLVRQELVKHDNSGKVYPKYTPARDPVVYLRGVSLSLGSQPPDGSYVQLAAPYPKAYTKLYADYEYSPKVEVTDEDSEVYGTNILRVIAARGTVIGRAYEGSIESVSEVANVTKSETYTVSSFAKEFIYLASMGTWEVDDVLEVDYVYVPPFDFVITGVSQKMRWEQAYVMEHAEALIVAPHWARFASGDLLTALSQEQFASAIIDPANFSGDIHEVRNYFDLSRLIRIIDLNGTEHDVDTAASLFERNQIEWVAAPSVKYTVQFAYHPTYVVLSDLPGMRSAENKSFVNRVGVVQYEHMRAEEVY